MSPNADSRNSNTMYIQYDVAKLFARPRIPPSTPVITIMGFLPILREKW